MVSWRCEAQRVMPMLDRQLDRLRDGDRARYVTVQHDLPWRHGRSARPILRVNLSVAAAMVLLSRRLPTVPGVPPGPPLSIVCAP